MSTIVDYFRGKTILVTGATGFLGQPLVEKILWVAPDVRRVYVLIREKRQGNTVYKPAERLERELYRSSAFDRLQHQYGDRLYQFLSEKLHAVYGDVSCPNLGLEPEIREQFRQELDVIINSAAVVSFDAPLDEAVEMNALGAQRLAQFASSCRKAVLVHVSTAYVCGASEGLVDETIYHSDPASPEPFPERRIRDVEEELGKISQLVAEVHREAASPEVEREFKKTLLRHARSRRRSRKTRRREKLEGLRKKWLRNRLTLEGMAWARRRGWNDTYTYTKALGEQLVVRSRGKAPTLILRPSVIESSLSEPSPGWLDGLRMADPLIVAIGKGRLRSLPLNPNVNLDLVPVDMVGNALLAAIPALREPGQLEILQVATAAENPITLGRLYDLIYEYFLSNPMLDREGNPIRIRRLRFPHPSTFRLQHRLKLMPLRTAERTLDKLTIFDSTQKVRRRLAATRAAQQKLYYYGEIYEPYLNMNCTFRVDKTMALFDSLSEEEQRRFNFDVRRLNWRHYIQNVHIPGVKKFILKIEGTGSLELEEPVLSPGGPFSTINELLDYSAARFPRKTALQMKRGNGWVAFTFSQLQEKAREVGLRLARFGIRKGDRVVLFSENQPEWGIAYLGAVAAGAVVVPLDAQTWHQEVWSVCRFTEARALLVSRRCLGRLDSEGLRKNEGASEPVVLLDVDNFCRPAALPEYPRSSSPPPLAGEVHLPHVEPDDLASIIFTTGTAVDPRGAMHTHRNFLNNLLGVNRYLSVCEGDNFLSVLPLYHALEFACGFLMALYGGATVTYVHSLKPKVILETMRETRTTCMLGVPTLYALIREDIERRILGVSKSNFKSNLMQTSKQLSRSVQQRFGKNIGRQLFARVHEEFGGKIRVFVSGGSALGKELYRDFKALGMEIYEGYGLTETAPVLTVNPLHRSREGSVGKPIPGVELRLYHPDRSGVGEIIVRSPSLMKGYYRNPRATAEVIRDGWLHTGDLGWVDTDGYVYITGRVKEVIVTGAGKNVYPADLEAIYKTVPGVREICVVGLRSGLTEDVHAVVVPTEELLEKAGDEAKRQIQREIQKLARELPSYHRLQTIRIWTEPLPRTEKGEIARREVRSRLEAQLRGEKEGPTVRKTVRADDRAQNQILYEELERLSGLAAGEITEESHLISDLGLDSLQALELLLFLEHRFGVSVPDERVSGLQTVGDVIRELRRLGSPGGEARPAAGKPAPVRSTLPLATRPARDRFLLSLSHTLLRGLYRTCFRLECNRMNCIGEGEPFILAANHSSHLDAGAVITAVALAHGPELAQKIHVLGARDYFFDTPLKSWFFSTFLNLVPIEREENSLAGMRMIKGILSQKEPILIFPEGSRSRSGTLQKFKPGIGLIAWELQVPVVPAYIEGAYQAMPPGSRLPRPGRIRVLFGNPVCMEQYRHLAGAGVPDELYRRITADVYQAIQNLAADSAAS